MNTRTSAVRRGFCAVGAAAALGLGIAGPADARPEPGEPVPTVVITDPPPPGPRDDSALEWVQVGGGVLAGLALAGAGWAMASRRQHAGPHPA